MQITDIQTISLQNKSKESAIGNKRRTAHFHIKSIFAREKAIRGLKNEKMNDSARPKKSRGLLALSPLAVFLCRTFVLS